MFMKNVDDEEDYKSIKLPVFSDGSEWEAVVFELKINLEKVWKHSKEMDIVDYLEGIQQFCNRDIIKKADRKLENKRKTIFCTTKNWTN